MPKRRRRHPRPQRGPWNELARAQRKRMLIRVRNNIRESRPYFRGLFHTSDVLDANRGWIDLVFLSRRRPGDYYNVTLQTAFCEFSEKINDLAWELNPRASGLEAVRKRLAAEGQVFSTERAELDFSYTAGVGLHATVNEPYLSPEAVERFVLAFLDGGELAYERSERLSWPLDEAPFALFPNPVGDDDHWSQPWAVELLARNLARNEQEALARQLPAALAKLPPRPL